MFVPIAYHCLFFDQMDVSQAFSCLDFRLRLELFDFLWWCVERRGNLPSCRCGPCGWSKMRFLSSRPNWWKVDVKSDWTMWWSWGNSYLNRLSLARRPWWQIWYQTPPGLMLVSQLCCLTWILLLTCFMIGHHWSFMLQSTDSLIEYVVLPNRQESRRPSPERYGSDHPRDGRHKIDSGDF